MHLFSLLRLATMSDDLHLTKTYAIFSHEFYIVHLMWLLQSQIYNTRKEWTVWKYYVSVSR